MTGDEKEYFYEQIKQLEQEVLWQEAELMKAVSTHRFIAEQDSAETRQDLDQKVKCLIHKRKRALRELASQVVIELVHACNCDAPLVYVPGTKGLLDRITADFRHTRFPEAKNTDIPGHIHSKDLSRLHPNQTVYRVHMSRHVLSDDLLAVVLKRIQQHYTEDICDQPTESSSYLELQRRSAEHEAARYRCKGDDRSTQELAAVLRCLNPKDELIQGQERWYETELRKSLFFKDPGTCPTYIILKGKNGSWAWAAENPSQELCEKLLKSMRNRGYSKRS